MNSCRSDLLQRWECAGCPGVWGGVSWLASGGGADRWCALRAQPLLCLSAVQAQKLVAVSAQYRQQTAALAAQRCELYKAMRPPAPPRPSACQEELIRDFLLVRPAAGSSWAGVRSCCASLPSEQIVGFGGRACDDGGGDE